MKTKNQMTLIAKMYRLKIPQKNRKKNLNIHVVIQHMMSTLSAQNFGDLSAPEVVSH